MNYAVNDIYACIQGEGVNAGLPMILIRTQGCSVGCSFCDTKETWGMSASDRVRSIPDALGSNGVYAIVNAEEIAAYCLSAHPEIKRVMLTGGEPADRRLGDLIAALRRSGLWIAVETSGTAIGHIDPPYADWICVSPKVGMAGGREIQPEAVAYADELRFVIGREEDLSGVEDFILQYRTRPEVVITLSPMSVSPKATVLCVDACLARGWRFSCQMHKYLGVR